jgi:hypothetical protein
VIQATNNKLRNNIVFDVIIELCRILLNVIQNCKVNYVRRQVNRVIHELAQETHFNVSLQIFYYYPLCIDFIIMNEIH